MYGSTEDATKMLEAMETQCLAATCAEAQNTMAVPSTHITSERSRVVFVEGRT